MIEKIIQNKEELNAVAKHLREVHDFDELRRLAREWTIPRKDVENFIIGKRCFLAEIEVGDYEYATAEEKIRKEMWILKDRDFADVISQHLVKKCEDEFFSSQVLQPHKTLQKCLNYVMEQAYEIAEKKYKALKEESGDSNRNVAMACSEIQVYQWAEDYYMLDDAEDEEKKREEDKKEIQKEYVKEERRKATSAKKKAAVGKNGNAKQGTTQPKKDEAAEKPEEAQISLFDMMNGTPDKEEKSESV